jgi:hypothetical protein
MEWLALLRVAAFVGGLATVFAVARRWPGPVLALVAALTAAGTTLLGWAASEGLWPEPGKIQYGSPAAESAFRVGFPVTAIGASVVLIGLMPASKRLGTGTKAVVADVAIRVAGTWVVGSFFGVVLYSLVTGYVK